MLNRNRNQSEVTGNNDAPVTKCVTIQISIFHILLLAKVKFYNVSHFEDSIKSQL